MKYYLYTASLIILTFFIFLIFFQQEHSKDQLQELRSYVIEEFTKSLEFEEDNLLSFSFALSENITLKNTLKEKDAKKAHEILDSLSNRFKTYTKIKNLRLQIFDKHFYVLAQNWKKNTTTSSLSKFRSDLKQFFQDQKPKVGVETGRRLTFKATIPLLEEGKTIGYLEVIKFIDEFADKFHKKNIGFFALMRSKYIKEDSLMKGFPLLNKYIIANENYNTSFKAKASHIDWKQLKALGYELYKDNLFILEPMYNGEHKKIGYYLLVLPPETLHAYKKHYQNTSLFKVFSYKDVYNFVKKSDTHHLPYEGIKDRELFKLLQHGSKKEKEDVKKSLQVRFRKYSKEELINFILNNQHIEQKRGEIR